MQLSNFIILYVTNIAASTAFYEALLSRKPVQASSAFVVFALPNGMRLGLWLNGDVAPTVSGMIGGSEVVLSCEDDAGVDAGHKELAARGVEILQAPTRMGFGYTFTAADPDGHRLRVYHPAANPQ